MNIHILHRAAPLAIVLATLGCGTASALAGEAPAMPLAGAAAAPAGFLEMCERSPAECVSTARPTDQMLTDVRVVASRARWASVFLTAGIPTAPATIAPSPEPRVISVLPERPVRPGQAAAPGKTTATTPQQVRAKKDELRKGRRTVRSKGARTPHFTTPRSAPAELLPDALVATSIVSPPRYVAQISTEALESVSRRFNRAIRRASDAVAYGREDAWVLPGGPRPSGDCEDYVLAKRRDLIEQGVDPAALSIAVVRTRRGDIHAVLLVATPEGEQVLDNLSPWVLPWQEAPYTWLQRQAPGQPMVWVNSAA